MRTTAMKKYILPFLILAVLALASCTKNLEAEISALRAEVIELESQVSKYNTLLNKLSDLVSALEKNDHIRSITKMGDDTYLISFTSGNVLTLSNGKTGVTPIVGVQYNETLGHYYWTIQMGPDGKVTWMTNSLGQRVRATGSIPRLRIENGYWQFSLDEGATWTPCGWGNNDAAQGNEGKPFFQSIDTSDPYYVIFTLANGIAIKLPTQKGFDELTDMCNAINNEFETYTQMVNNLDGKMFIKTIAEWQENGQHVGYILTMEDGSILQIRDGRDYNFTTQISARQDTDGRYYWIYRTDPSQPYEWLIYQGKKVPVTPDDVTPRIGIMEVNGELCFTIGYEGAEPELMRDAEGNPVQATGRAGFSLVKDAEIAAGCIKLVLADGSVVTMVTNRVFTPSLTLTQSITSVARDTYYETQLQATIVDTLQMMALMPNYDTYCGSTQTSVTAMAVDGGYTTEPTLVSYSYVNSPRGTIYTIVLNIPFRTASSPWDASRQSRVAVFLNWGYNTTMRVATFANM